MYRIQTFVIFAIGNYNAAVLSYWAQLISTFKSDTNVDFDFNCDDIHLNIKQALPCSLIVNEIVTNILKHAFIGRKRGKISISIDRINDMDVLVEVSDNGIGLPDNFKSKESTSLGMTLIEVLSTQLNANYKYESSNNGTTFSLEFLCEE